MFFYIMSPYFLSWLFGALGSLFESKWGFQNNTFKQNILKFLVTYMNFNLSIISCFITFLQYWCETHFNTYSHRKLFQYMMEVIFSYMLIVQHMTPEKISNSTGENAALVRYFLSIWSSNPGRSSFLQTAPSSEYQVEAISN